MYVCVLCVPPPSQHLRRGVTSCLSAELLVPSKHSVIDAAANQDGDHTAMLLRPTVSQIPTGAFPSHEALSDDSVFCISPWKCLQFLHCFLVLFWRPPLMKIMLARSKISSQRHGWAFPLWNHSGLRQPGFRTMHGTHHYISGGFPHHDNQSSHWISNIVDCFIRRLIGSPAELALLPVRARTDELRLSIVRCAVASDTENKQMFVCLVSRCAQAAGELWRGGWG